MKRLAAENEGDLRQILDLVHDRRFSIEELLFEPDRRRLMVPLSVIDSEKQDVHRRHLILESWYHRILYAQLIVNEVVSFSLRDEAGVGGAAINRFVVREGHLVIECDLPVVFELEIKRLSVELLLSDTIVGSVRRTRVSVPRSWRNSGDGK